jgi:hypothetical protein
LVNQLHCYDNAFVVLVLGKSAPSFDYNNNIKGKGVERSGKSWKELERSKKKNQVGFHVGKGFQGQDLKSKRY